jgi:DNA-binding NarL/FixJ family response regulator
MKEAIRLIVVEDDPQVCERFERTFGEAPEIEVLAWTSTAAQAMAALEAHKPDVLLVDLGLPDANGITVIQRAHALHPECDIMVVTVFGDQRNVLASIEAGATGYLLKDDTQESFVSRIIELREGGSPITPIIARQLLRRLLPTPSDPSDEATPSMLSPREAEVLNLLSRGFAYQEIATLLQVSPHTIGTYVKRLYEKLQVSSRGEAIFEAQRMGLLAR